MNDEQSFLPPFGLPQAPAQQWEAPEVTMRRMFELRGMQLTPELKQAYLQMTAQGVMPHEAAHRLWVQQPPSPIQPPQPLGGLLGNWPTGGAV